MSRLALAHARDKSFNITRVSARLTGTFTHRSCKALVQYHLNVTSHTRPTDMRVQEGPHVKSLILNEVKYEKWRR